MTWQKLSNWASLLILHHDTLDSKNLRAKIKLVVVFDVVKSLHFSKQTWIAQDNRDLIYLYNLKKVCI